MSATRLRSVPASGQLGTFPHFSHCSWPRTDPICFSIVISKFQHMHKAIGGAAALGESGPRSHSLHGMELPNTGALTKGHVISAFPRIPWKSLIHSGCVYPRMHAGRSCCVPRNTGSGPSVLWRGQRSEKSSPWKNAILTEAGAWALHF